MRLTGVRLSHASSCSRHYGCVRHSRLQLDWAVDGLRQVGNQIRYVVPRHEQSTAYMADGYAAHRPRSAPAWSCQGPACSMPWRASPRLTPAIRKCWRSSATSTRRRTQGLGPAPRSAQSIEILGAVTKWHAQARSPKDIPGLVREAVWQLRSGRPQPVGVEISVDLLSAADDIDLIQPNPAEDGACGPTRTLVERAAEMLAGARLPVIYAGGGVLAARASAALAALAEKLQAPVVLSENGRGALSDHHPLALTALAGRAVFAHADVALIVGSRFAIRRWACRHGAARI